MSAVECLEQPLVIRVIHATGHQMRAQVDSFESGGSRLRFASAHVPGGRVFVQLTGKHAGLVRSSRSSSSKGRTDWYVPFDVLRRLRDADPVLRQQRALTQKSPVPPASPPPSQPKRQAESLVALSLIQPYAWALIYAGKSVENRRRSDGRPPQAILNHRGTLAIHASKRRDADYYDRARETIIDATAGHVEPPDPSELSYGAIIGTVEVFGHVDDQGRYWSDPGATVPLQDVPESATNWHFEGSYGLVVRSPKPSTQPLAARGSLGLWPVAADLVAKL